MDMRPLFVIKTNNIKMCPLFTRSPPAGQQNQRMYYYVSNRLTLQFHAPNHTHPPNSPPEIELISVYNILAFCKVEISVEFIDVRGGRSWNTQSTTTQ